MIIIREDGIGTEMRVKERRGDIREGAGAGVARSFFVQWSDTIFGSADF